MLQLHCHFDISFSHFLLFSITTFYENIKKCLRETLHFFSWLSNIAIIFRCLCVAIGFVGKRKDCIGCNDCCTGPSLKVNLLVDGHFLKFSFKASMSFKKDLLDYFSLLVNHLESEMRRTLVTPMGSTVGRWVQSFPSSPPLTEKSLTFAWNLL